MFAYGPFPFIGLFSDIELLLGLIREDNGIPLLVRFLLLLLLHFSKLARPTDESLQSDQVLEQDIPIL